MREILFRGKAINRIGDRHYCTNYKNGDWVHGLIERLYDDAFPNLPATIRNTDGVSDIDIDYTTIGQYTGLKDKTGKRIYDADICTDGETIFEIVWNEDRYGFYCKVLKSKHALITENMQFPLWHWNDCPKNGNMQLEIIGNIHDNPELLKGE